MSDSGIELMFHFEVFPVHAVIIVLFLALVKTPEASISKAVDSTCSASTPLSCRVISPTRSTAMTEQRQRCRRRSCGEMWRENLLTCKQRSGEAHVEDKRGMSETEADRPPVKQKQKWLGSESRRTGRGDSSV